MYFLFAGSLARFLRVTSMTFATSRGNLDPSVLFCYKHEAHCSVLVHSQRRLQLNWSREGLRLHHVIDCLVGSSEDWSDSSPWILVSPLPVGMTTWHTRRTALFAPVCLWHGLFGSFRLKTPRIFSAEKRFDQICHGHCNSSCLDWSLVKQWPQWARETRGALPCFVNDAPI